MTEGQAFCHPVATQVERVEVAGGGEGSDSAEGFGGWLFTAGVFADEFAFGRTLARCGLVMAGDVTEGQAFCHPPAQTVSKSSASSICGTATKR